MRDEQVDAGQAERLAVLLGTLDQLDHAIDRELEDLAAVDADVLEVLQQTGPRRRVWRHFAGHLDQFLASTVRVEADVADADGATGVGCGKDDRAGTVAEEDATVAVLEI